MATLYLSLGSNVGNRVQNLESAIAKIDSVIGKVQARSSVIETLPWGFASSNTFMNMAVSVETNLSPDMVLKMINRIETELGRTSKSHNGIYSDRPIDIDILLYDNCCIDTEELTIPHKLMTEREFVLAPLAQIAPNVIHPGLGKSITELLQSIK
ncbi:MAG: 2-amino-4-hydroxy-6-hydroxymethyldihydropteridine diphosphokinase [Bacteroidaceae bacterium]|nr:2-amino-4-hydroxy-6-hydroxymethyldihydropteridine diphosphokinase [Bacteroidaceae bacterium]